MLGDRQNWIEVWCMSVFLQNALSNFFFRQSLYHVGSSVPPKPMTQIFQKVNVWARRGQWQGDSLRQCVLGNHDTLDQSLVCVSLSPFKAQAFQQIFRACRKQWQGNSLPKCMLGNHDTLYQSLVCVCLSVSLQNLSLRKVNLWACGE